MKKLLSLFLVTFLFTQDYSLYFDGIDDYVSIPALSESIENSNATLMGWFKLDTYPIQSHGGIFGFRNYSSNGYGNFFAVILGSPDAEHNNIECMMNSDTANIEGPFTDSNFYHIAITYNGSSFSSYLNGVLQNTVNTSYVGSGSPLDLFIGKNAGWEDYFFNGLIDDVSLWNLSLSDSEIQSYMQEEILGNEEGLIGYWKFDENDGNIAYDQSVNQNHGSIYGAQWISNDEILGCTDELACNYNEAANVEDGTCEYSCHDNGDYSLSFDGEDDYVNLGTGLNLLGSYTLELKISTEYNEESCIIGKVRGGETDNSSWALHMMSEGTLVWGNNEGANNNYFQSSGQSINDGQEHDIAIIFDSEGLYGSDQNTCGDIGLGYMLIDGIQVGVSCDGGNFNNTSILTGLAAQRHGDDSGWYYNWLGTISQVKISNSISHNVNGYDILDNYLVDENTIALWDFNSGDGNVLYDLSGNQNHGTIYGAQWVSNETLGCTDELACNYNEAANVEDGTCEYSCHDNGDYSLSFDGDDDYVDLGSQLDIIGDFTIEANIMISDSGNDEQVYTIFSKSDETYTSGPPKGYMLEIYHRELHFGYRLTNGGSWEQINSNTTIDYDVWYNISVSRSNNEIQISIDGSPVGSGTLSEEITFPDSVNMNIGRFWMGDFGYDNEYHFHGMIKNFSLTIDNENLIGQWSFYKGEGDILYDYSGNQNHGTIYGAQWTSNVVVGDSNLDGNIDVLDVITVVNYIINNDDLNDQQFQVSDLNNSGDINITDIVLLVELILNS